MYKSPNINKNWAVRLIISTDAEAQLSGCWVLVLMSKSVIIGLLHSCNWLKSWIFVHLFEFQSRFNIWLTWIGSEYFKSLVNWTLFVEFCFTYMIHFVAWSLNKSHFLTSSHFVRKGPVQVIIAIFTQFFLGNENVLSKTKM